MKHLVLKSEKVQHTLHRGEAWVHALYCGVLFIEGHGLYATVGGVLGMIVLINTIFGD